MMQELAEKKATEFQQRFKNSNQSKWIKKRDIEQFSSNIDSISTSMENIDLNNENTLFKRPLRS